MWAREQSESGWRLWIADVVLWGFGRGRARLNPSPAGWHRGEEEVTTPQPIKQRVVRVRRERKPGPSARKPGLQRGEASASSFGFTRTQTSWRLGGRLPEKAMG